MLVAPKQEQRKQKENKHFYSISEVADILEVSEDTIRRMIDTGDLEAVQIRRQWRIKKEPFDRKYLS